MKYITNQDTIKSLKSALKSIKIAINHTIPQHQYLLKQSARNIKKQITLTKHRTMKYLENTYIILLSVDDLSNFNHDKYNTSSSIFDVLEITPSTNFNNRAGHIYSTDLTHASFDACHECYTAILNYDINMINIETKSTMTKIANRFSLNNPYCHPHVMSRLTFARKFKSLVFHRNKFV